MTFSFRKCGDCKHWATTSGENGFCVIPGEAKKGNISLLERWTCSNDGCEADDALAKKAWLELAENQRKGQKEFQRRKREREESQQQFIRRLRELEARA